MKYIPLKKQLLRERKKNNALLADNEKNKADIDYIAMMCDIELEMPTEEETEDEYEI